MHIAIGKLSFHISLMCNRLKVKVFSYLDSSRLQCQQKFSHTCHDQSPHIYTFCQGKSPEIE